MFFFVIWRGWGILAVVIPAAICFVCVAIGGALGGASNRALGPALGLVVGGAISAYVVWRLGVRLNSQPGRVLVDPSDGSKVVLRQTHSLFWIPMQWWAPIVGALALIAAILTAATPSTS